jgi:type II secretory pathway pseudopilin PulG
MAGNMRMPPMRRRNGFTIMEIFVVIAIILVLGTILLAAVSHIRRKAEINGEQLDFQAISAALENYRNDFGDYPRNFQLATWDTALGTSPPTTPPLYPSLATALMGPGPGAPQNIGSGQIFTAGDGADGPGFRTQTMNIPCTVSGGTVTFNSTLSVAPVWTQGQSVWWFDQAPTGGSVIHQYFGVVNTASVAPTVSTTQVTGITWSSGGNANPAPSGPGVLRIATGRTWGPYLPPERFQVVYVDPTLTGTATDPGTGIHFPVLLDRWGGIIQYFPAYGPTNNRLSNANGNAASSYYNSYAIFGLTQQPIPPLFTVTAGPLFGFATPATIDTTTPTGIVAPYGSYSIYDQRDSVPILDSVSPKGPEYIPWHLYTYVNSRPNGQTITDLSLAVKWMLGDDNFDNLVDNSETYRNTQSYILISAGPDGPNRNDGGFCDFYPL